ncbi:SLBB domain-containing protein [bacterium]|nr:SLBB domain-containing protein [bacterium]
MGILLRCHSIPEIDTIDVYLRHGGYQALAKAVRLGPREIVEQVRKSGLRGRGGAGFPTATKWDAVLSQERKPHYLICNIAEGEPGSFKDRELVKNPHMVLESTAIAAFAVGAEKAFLFLRGIFAEEEESLKRALIAARNHKFLGNDGMLKVELVIHCGEDSYIAGEETAMIESLEGKPAIPRVKPPRPHDYGLWECPTVVNNVETLCNTIPILMQGSETFRKLGTKESPGSKLFCLSGQIRKPGVYECPLGIQLSTLLNDFGGGPLPGRRFIAIFPGGPSTPIVPVELDPFMDFENLQKVGSHLGTGGVIVIDDSSDLRQVAVQTLSFFMRESCGVCPPCFIGTQELHKLFQVQRSDVLKIREFCEMMKYRGQCAHSRAAALTSLSFLNQFPQVFGTNV